MMSTSLDRLAVAANVGTTGRLATANSYQASPPPSCRQDAATCNGSSAPPRADGRLPSTTAALTRALHRHPAMLLSSSSGIHQACAHTHSTINPLQHTETARPAPHRTRPYKSAGLSQALPSTASIKSSSARQGPAAAAAATDGGPTPLCTTASYPSPRCATAPYASAAAQSTAAAAPDSRRPPGSSSCSSQQQKDGKQQAATMPRPGSAAAGKILRSMRSRSNAAPWGSHTPRCTTAALLEAPALQHLHQQQHCQAAGVAARPATMGTLLASDGVAERLAFYQRINSALDEADGFDIVADPPAAESGLPALPEWLAADEVAGSHQAMVLNLEDLAKSTAEVLEQEIAAYLAAALDNGELESVSLAAKGENCPLYRL